MKNENQGTNKNVSDIPSLKQKDNNKEYRGSA